MPVDKIIFLFSDPNFLKYGKLLISPDGTLRGIWGYKLDFPFWEVDYFFHSLIIFGCGGNSNCEDYNTEFIVKFYDSSII